VSFLTYDLATLFNWYRDEKPALGQLPYTELDCFLDQSHNLTIERDETPFQLATHPPDNLAQLQDCIYDEFTRQRRIDKFDSHAVRLEKYDPRERRLTIRQCRYSDGVKSNYALDWQGKLRSYLAQDYGSALPPLDEPRLSNALGLAIIVFYRSSAGPMIPYLPKRAGANQAVFPGGLFHCSASGEAEWKLHATTFDELFTGHMCRELYEEVGLNRADLDWIFPVALCREFLRGGKPQLFFVASANVGEEQLTTKRRAAIERQIRVGRQEVLDEVLPVESLEQLYSDLASSGTIESFANMCYAQRCARLAL
jgi:hypothetical protein